MMQKIRNFISSRYGIDLLGKICIVLTLIFYVLTMVTKIKFLFVFNYFFFFIFLMRALSSDHYRRQQENEMLLRRIDLTKMQFRDRKSYRYYQCKCCSKILRVPKGKGKIEVKCPRCGTKKIHRT